MKRSASSTQLKNALLRKSRKMDKKRIIKIAISVVAIGVAYYFGGPDTAAKVVAVISTLLGV